MRGISLAKWIAIVVIAGDHSFATHCCCIIQIYSMFIVNSKEKLFSSYMGRNLICYKLYHPAVIGVLTALQPTAPGPKAMAPGCASRWHASDAGGTKIPTWIISSIPTWSIAISGTHIGGTYLGKGYFFGDITPKYGLILCSTSSLGSWNSHAFPAIWWMEKNPYVIGEL